MLSLKICHAICDSWIVSLQWPFACVYRLIGSSHNFGLRILKDSWFYRLWITIPGTFGYSAKHLAALQGPADHLSGHCAHGTVLTLSFDHRLSLILGVLFKLYLYFCVPSLPLFAHQNCTLLFFCWQLKVIWCSFTLAVSVVLSPLNISCYCLLAGFGQGIS